MTANKPSPPTVIERSMYGCPEHGVVDSTDAKIADWYCPTCGEALVTVECVIVPTADYRGVVKALGEIDDLLADVNGATGTDHWLVLRAWQLAREFGGQ